MKIIHLSLVCLLISMSQTFAQFNLAKLQVEYENVPMAIEVESPRFSWLMVGSSGRKGLNQTAYQIHVTSEGGVLFWDSGKNQSDISLAIPYKGDKLLPTTRYQWKVTVWDEKGQNQSAESYFETGLMNPSIEAWSGAQWIGGGDKDLVFYSHYFSVYKFSYGIQLDQRSKKAAFVFGGNDGRLMNKNLNIQGVENKRDESYIAFELDISEIANSGGKAKLYIYRVGYDKSDSREKPFAVLEIPENLINIKNQYEKHIILAESNFGVFTIYINQVKPENRITSYDPNAPRFVQQGLNLNPVGSGNNFISFPMLADIGFWMKPGQKALFSDVQIRNFRKPSNLLFGEDLNSGKSIFELKEGFLNINAQAYELSGGNSGILILADPSKGATPMLRTSFQAVNKNIKKARLYVTARGIYEMYFNGLRIGKDYFTPGLTQYNKHHSYQVYDVEIIPGHENVIGAWLAEGWWSGNITYSGENWNFFGDRQSLLAKLVINYEDGSEQIITSQPDTWKVYHNGPIQYGSFFQGEVYDAGKETKVEGWSSKGYDDSSWENASMVSLSGSAFLDPISNPQSSEIIRNYHAMKLVSHQGDNPSIVKILTPVSVEEVRPGVFVYDMGQNMVGFPQIELRDAKKGQQVILRFAEVRYPDLPEHEGLEGMIMLENIRAALTQDIYITKGGNEVIQPRFTFHGYRFLEITGIDQVIPVEEVRGMVVSSIPDLTAHYETSNLLVNKLWENITWSMRGNFLSIPTDTPARNERMGWSGDINVFARTATYMADLNLFLKRHLMAMRDIQREDGRFPDVAPVGGGFGGTLWGTAGIIVPWETYLQYGDTELLSMNYASMQMYMEFLESKTTSDGFLNEGPLGDWLSPENNKNDNTLFWTAYQINCLDIMEKISRILGLGGNADIYKNKKESRKSYFNTTYLNEDGKTVKSGMVTGMMPPPGESTPVNHSVKGQLIDTQGSYAIALDMGAVEEENKSKVLNNLKSAIERKNVDDLGELRPEYSLMTGFIGTSSIGNALSANGNHELVYRLLQQTSYPSWLYSVVNGATTIWERLNSYTVENGFGGNNSMNSFNHYSFGAIGAWMMNYSLGIQRNSNHPGFKHFLLQPNPDPDGVMTWAKGYYDSMYGRIESSWKIKNGGFIYEFTVPANTSATLYLHAKTIDDVLENGKPLEQADGVKISGWQDGKIILELNSGKYTFTVN
jgi:alpha-L-rhamnosidase